ncbi:cytochrome P450 [Salinispora arenicola]|uniref:Cytochrome P450 n=1 Tax=Salinispora arenicola TaxID=168697 RepID=A0A542XQD6_SALAC|nr:cytochrome P450 [Salinispora arenicola]TQL38066.1 pentalenic acid synthase [Salinispora arenicola]GIM87363.1 cytochrome P450 [Salinispora arenicola]
MSSLPLPTYPKLRDPADPLLPPAEYLAIQSEKPIAKVLLPSGRPTWLITGHALARQVLTEPCVSVDRRHPNFPYPVPNPDAVVAQVARWTYILLGDDPPLHTERRRLLISEFTVRQAQAMRPRIQQLVDFHLEQLIAAGPGADFSKHFAMKVPSAVICEMLGVPFADHDYFQERTALQLRRDVPVAAQKQAIDELLAYFEQLIQEKSSHPGDDVLSRLIVSNRETEAFDHEALVALGLLLLVGGHETTANTLTLATATMLERPEIAEQLRTDPSLMPSAVEEFLRYFSVAVAVSRIATADLQVGGQLVRAGESMLLVLNTIARDGTVFPEPHRLDIRRNARNHLAFSHGIHQCMGQNLARVEMQIALDTVLRRLPGLHLVTPFEELPFKYRHLVWGIEELRVAW